jgi:hypothetical protein
MVLTRFFSNKVQSIAPSSRSATANAEHDASQALLSRPGTEPSLGADWEVTDFRNVEDSGAQTLDLFATATQEPQAGGSNDRYETMRPKPKSFRPNGLRPKSSMSQHR